MATQKIAVYQVCAQCGGTGLQPIPTPGGGSTTGPCTWPGCSDPSLGEIGEYPIGHIYIAPSLEELLERHDELDGKLDDLDDKVSDVLDKCEDILEKLQE